MFHDIPVPVLTRMRELETIDQADRIDGTEHERRLRQVSPEAGRFLAVMAASAPAGTWVEVGTSGGYSALWISLAAREKDQHLITFEVLAEKAALARETIKQTVLEALIELIEGDGLKGLASIDRIAFCFLDADKAHALDYLNLILPKLVPGGLFLFDNVISHRDRIPEFLERVSSESRLDIVLVPIGKGLLVCRRANE